MKSNTNHPALDKLPSSLKKDLDKNLCTCMDVLRMDIINAIIDGATTIEAIKQQTYACTGAGCCEHEIERLIECLTSPEKPKRRRRKTG